MDLLDELSYTCGSSPVDTSFPFEDDYADEDGWVACVSLLPPSETNDMDCGIICHVVTRQT